MDPMELAEAASRIKVDLPVANSVRAIAETQGLTISEALKMLVDLWANHNKINLKRLTSEAPLTRFKTLDKRISLETLQTIKDGLEAAARSHFKEFDLSDLAAAKKIFKRYKSYHEFVSALNGYAATNPRKRCSFSHFLLSIEYIKPIESEKEWTHKRVLETIEKYK